MLRGMEKRMQTKAYRAAWRALYLVFIGLSLLSFETWAKADKAQLAVPVTVSGQKQLVLPAGTEVDLLKRDGDKATVNVHLADGSTLITQIAAQALTSMPATEVVNSSPVKKMLPDSAKQDANSEKQPVQAAATTTPDLSQSDKGDPPKEEIDLLKTNDSDEDVHPHYNSILSQSDLTLPGKKYTSLHGYFYVLINKIAVPVVYSLPMDHGHLATSASNLVFYAPWPHELTKLDRNIVPQIVENLGCTVFSLSFWCKPGDLDNPKTAYWDKESAWFPAVMAARDEIIKGFALERRKLILFGFSGGGGMALNLAAAYPGEVDAVASQGGNLAPDGVARNHIKWFIINTRGDTNATITHPFYDHLRSIGSTALYCETAPLQGRENYHVATKQAFDLIYAYIAGVLKQRELTAQENTSIAAIWPFSSPTNPLQRYAIIRTCNLNENEIASGKYDLLPSATFASLWSGVCPPTQKIAGDNGACALSVTLPALEKPLGTIIYYDRPTYQNIARVIEDIHAFAERGYIVVSPAFNAKPDEFIQSMTNWIHTQQTHGLPPLHLVAYSQIGANFISRMIACPDLSIKSVSLIDFDESEIDDVAKDGIERSVKGSSMYGFYTYLEHKSETSITKMGDDLMTAPSKERGCYNIIVHAKITQAVLDSDQAKISQDIDLLAGANNRVALDADRAPDQQSMGNIKAADIALGDQELAGMAKRQLASDYKQADQDSQNVDLDKELAQDDALKRVRALIAKYESN